MLTDTCALLHRLFKMKEENPDWLMEFQLFDNQKLHITTISQAQYINVLLKWHNMDLCTPVSTPMELGLLLMKKDCPTMDKDKAEMAETPYREVLGAIIWLTVVSCPNLTFSASYLGQYSVNPGKSHWKALLHILCYLQDTCTLTLTLGCVSDTDPDILTGYMEANWTHNINDYHSTSDYLFKLNDTTISWNSKKQSTVTSSSTEAEYITTSHSTKQAVWLHQLLIYAGIIGKPPLSTTLYVDNTGAILLTKEPHFHSCTHHIPVHFHFVCELINDDTLTYNTIHTYIRHACR